MALQSALEPHSQISAREFNDFLDNPRGKRHLLTERLVRSKWWKRMVFAVHEHYQSALAAKPRDDEAIVDLGKLLLLVSGR